MKRHLLALFAIAALMVGIFGGQTFANGRDDDDDDDDKKFRARLSGYLEVPPISTTGRGQFTSSLNSTSTTFSYTLTYSGLQSTASAAHIHFGQKAVAGGVVAFLCGGGGKPSCPATSGTVTGTLTASDVQALAAQGIAAGEFAEMIKAMRAKATYVNVHTSTFPSGEVRGNIQ